MNPIKYLAEVKSELSLVVWPKLNDVGKLTMIVILISVIVAVYLSLLDIGFTKLIGAILTH